MCSACDNNDFHPESRLKSVMKGLIMSLCLILT